MVIMISGVQFSRKPKLCQQSTAVASASNDSPVPVRSTSPGFKSFKSKHTKLKKIWATGKDQPIWQTWRSLIRLQRQQTRGDGGLLPHQLGSQALFRWSDDSRWARGGRVRVRWRGKVPEEPLAFTLAPLVQVVLLVPLLACSLVVVILFQVPHWWPAVLLKVLLVLCFGEICLRWRLQRLQSLSIEAFANILSFYNFSFLLS